MSSTYEHKLQMIPLIPVSRNAIIVRFDLYDEWYTAIDFSFLGWGKSL